MKKLILVAITIVLSVLIISVAGSNLYRLSSKIIHSQANIKAVNVSIWLDENLINKLTQIDWGTLEPGESKDFVGYVSSSSNVPVTLTMFTSGWTPENASNHISIVWNLEEETLSPGQHKQFVFVLTVSPDITGITHFEFDITVAGRG